MVQVDEVSVAYDSIGMVNSFLFVLLLDGRKVVIFGGRTILF